jgi:hypothetical protein
MKEENEFNRDDQPWDANQKLNDVIGLVVAAVGSQHSDRDVKNSSRWQQPRQCTLLTIFNDDRNYISSRKEMVNIPAGRIAR